MARWNMGPEAMRNPVLHSLRAACEINSITTTMHNRYPEITTPIRLGVGINAGTAAVGIGAENTALGDTVNLAFRLESATKDLKTDIVLADSVCELLPKSLWENNMHDISVKGKAKKIHVCALSFEEIQRFCASHDATQQISQSELE